MIDKLINQNENGSRFAEQFGNSNHICLLLGEFKGMELKTFGWKKAKAKNIQGKNAPKSHPYTITCRSWLKSTHYIFKSLYWPTHPLIHLLLWFSPCNSTRAFFATSQQTEAESLAKKISIGTHYTTTTPTMMHIKLHTVIQIKMIIK